MGRERPYGDLSVEELRLQIAAISGPLRAPFGRLQPILFAAGQEPAARAAFNASSPRPLYVEVLRIPGGAAAPLPIFIGSNESLSANGSLSYPFDIGDRRSFLLLPSDSLYLRPANGDACSFLIAQVSL